MKGNGIFSFPKFGRTKAFLIENRLWIFLVLLFFVGLFFGLFIFKPQSVFSEFCEEFIEKYYSGSSDIAFFSRMIKSFLRAVLLVALCFMGGTSAFGSIIAPGVTMLYGLYFGVLSAGLYNGYSLKGIAFYAIMILPAAVLNIIAVLCASAESVRFSLIIAKLALPSAIPADISRDFKEYFIKFLPIVSLSLLSAIVDAILSVKLLDMFSLF